MVDALSLGTLEVRLDQSPSKLIYWSNCRCPCWLQGSWTRWTKCPLQIKKIIWLYDSMIMCTFVTYRRKKKRVKSFRLFIENIVYVKYPYVVFNYSYSRDVEVNWLQGVFSIYLNITCSKFQRYLRSFLLVLHCKFLSQNQSDIKFWRKACNVFCYWLVNY